MPKSHVVVGRYIVSATEEDGACIVNLATPNGEKKPYLFGGNLEKAIEDGLHRLGLYTQESLVQMDGKHKLRSLDRNTLSHENGWIFHRIIGTEYFKADSQAYRVS